MRSLSPALSAAELPVAGEISPGVTVVVIVDGWAADLQDCISRVLKHTSAKVLMLDIATDESSFVAIEFGEKFPDRVSVIRSVKLGWSKCLLALIRAATTDLIAVMDISTLFDADALAPLVQLLREDQSLTAVGWKGVNVDLENNWFTSSDAVGEVDQLLGYLLLIRREQALNTPPHKDARFYRNADMEWSLALRESGGKLVAPNIQLPITQGRHHGYFDTDPQYRDKESQKNYSRMLQRFRGKTSILAPRQ